MHAFASGISDVTQEIVFSVNANIKSSQVL